MKIQIRYPVPTGDILIVSGEKGSLEMLSLGDYGKEVNLSHKEVKHQALLPLSEKWVITISSQYGCSSNCLFCDVPKVGPGINATKKDLFEQVLIGLNLHPEIKKSKRLNIHFARMGEPTWNINVISCAKMLKDFLEPDFLVHPVVSTMMPRNNKKLRSFIDNWMYVKNNIYHGEAGLQISINSTDEKERSVMFSDSQEDIETIADMLRAWVPVGRKITLNFAIADYTIDAVKLANLFDPRYFICKLTPMHKTNEAEKHFIKTSGDYTTPEPYLEVEKNLIDAGFDVLVFIASKEEDESRITCGNAILSGLKG